METFGEKFGKLVRQYRESRGDTLDSLVAEIEARQPVSATGKKLRVPRASTISDIETGKVPRPQAATVKVLAAALDIPQAKIDACRDPSAADKAHLREIDKLNAYVDTLEARLEAQKEELRTAHAEERARLQQTINELTSRLANPETAFREYQDKITQLEQLLDEATDATAAIGANRIADAKALAEQGEFEAADEIFAEVQEIEQAAVTRAADAAFGRGLIAEEQIRWADAARHYARAAKLSESFDTLRKASDYAERAGDYESAARFSEVLVAFAKANEPQERVSNALNEHALNLRSLGRYEEAETLFWQALKIDKATIGEAHPSYATRLNNLAGVVQAQGRYAEAETLYRQALEIDRVALGETHPGYATDLNNLAGVVRAQGRYAEAETLYRQALEIGKVTIGEAHPDYATRLNNLAGPGWPQGRNAEAETLFRQALEIDKATIGEAHPGYATDRNNLAVLYANMERFDEALPLIEQALAIQEDKLGPDHPDTVTTRGSLANLRAMMKE